MLIKNQETKVESGIPNVKLGSRNTKIESRISNFN